MKNEIFVVYDCLNNYCNDYFLQIISKAHSLAEKLEAKVTVFCFGDDNKEDFEKIHSYGADKINRYIIKDINSSIITDILSDYIKYNLPKMIMFTDSEMGRCIASSISIRFNSGLTADCINIFADENKVITFQRAAMNASLIANIKTQNSLFDLCTVKKNIFEKKIIDNKKNLEVNSYDYSNYKYKKNYDILELVDKKIKKDNSNIHAAKVVIGVGRGIKNKENYNKLLEIAKKVNAEIIGTRAAVEEGFMDESRQVGQSGETISPDIYIALGISGASQHIVGIKNTKIIAAVNIDENAPIFNYADYVIIEDLEKLLNEIYKLVC